MMILMIVIMPHLERRAVLRECPVMRRQLSSTNISMNRLEQEEHYEIMGIKVWWLLLIYGAELENSKPTNAY